MIFVVLGPISVEEFEASAARRHSEDASGREWEPSPSREAIPIQIVHVENRTAVKFDFLDRPTASYLSFFLRWLLGPCVHGPPARPNA